jgi:hypothetical protein
MKKLNELVNILHKRQSPVLKAWLAVNVSTRQVQLYQGIARNNFKSDVSASMLLYGKADSAAYRKLKADLKTKLLEFVIYLDISEEVTPPEMLSKIQNLEREIIKEKLILMGAKFILEEFTETPDVII